MPTKQLAEHITDLLTCVSLILRLGFIVDFGLVDLYGESLGCYDSRGIIRCLVQNLRNRPSLEQPGLLGDRSSQRKHIILIAVF